MQVREEMRWAPVLERLRALCPNADLELRFAGGTWALTRLCAWAGLSPDRRAKWSRPPRDGWGMAAVRQDRPTLGTREHGDWSGFDFLPPHPLSDAVAGFARYDGVFQDFGGAQQWCGTDDLWHAWLLTGDPADAAKRLAHTGAEAQP
jgi:hypothetical protein